MDDVIVIGLISFAIGVLTMSVVCVMHATPDNHLRKVGIERIEYCHNTQSNWYEIVWKEGHK